MLSARNAVLAALAWLARSGVVIKGSAALERLARSAGVMSPPLAATLGT